MIIRLASLHNGLNNWDESIEPSGLELDERSFKSKVDVCIEADKRSGRIDILLDVKTDYSFICDRCGEDARLRVDGSISVHFIQRESAFPDEMPGDELRSFLPGQPEINIRTDVRDALLLAVPMKLLCREDCKGLCQKCGTNLNIEMCRCDRQ